MNKNKWTFNNQEKVKDNLIWELKNKEEIIYKLQIKNSELEIIVNKQNFLLIKLEDELDFWRNNLNSKVQLVESEFKNKVNNIKINNFNKTIETSKNIKSLLKYKEKYENIFNKNLNLRNENVKIKKYVKDLEFIINNNNLKISELQEDIKNIDENQYNINETIKEELYENYEFLKKTDYNYNKWINILDILE